jgi:hypothetical protein
MRLCSSAGASGNSPEVISLAEEIVAHLRGLAGADAMLAAYNQARESVKSQRGERRHKEAMQVGGMGFLVRPAASWRLRTTISSCFCFGGLCSYPVVATTLSCS